MARTSPFMDLGGDTEILNGQEDFGALYARRGIKTRKKARTTVEIVSEPLLHDFDEYVLGSEPAQAIRDVLERQIKAITEFAAPATLRKREQAEKALAAGAKWATKRYSGGRTGVKPPNQTSRLFNDSGRLAEGVFVRQNREDRTFTVNVPANRLDPTTFGDGFGRMLDRLKQLVPVLGDSRKLLAEPEVRSAINESIGDLITKAKHGQEKKLQQLRAARRRAVLALVRGFR